MTQFTEKKLNQYRYIKIIRGQMETYECKCNGKYLSANKSYSQRMSRQIKSNSQRLPLQIKSYSHRLYLQMK